MGQPSTKLAALLLLVACTEATLGPGDDAPGGVDAALDAAAGAHDAAGGAPDAAGGLPDAPPPDEPAALAGITAAHNEVRAMVGVPPLSWDPALAVIAQGWAEQCVDVAAPAGLIDHNPGRSDTYPQYVGENIYGSTAATAGTAAVSSWASEGAYWHNDTATCDAGRVCGHYTQVVWRTTTKVGCGVYDCPALTFGYSIVCNYAPGGNSGGPAY